MKKNILKVVAVIIVVAFVYFGWKIYNFSNSIKNFGESLNETLTTMPIVKQEIYSPDSLQKIGAYRFLITGSGSFEVSPFEVSLIDSSMEYPKAGNILSGIENEPVIQWFSPDSILIYPDTTMVYDSNTFKELKNITIIIKE